MPEIIEQKCYVFFGQFEVKKWLKYLKSLPKKNVTFF